MSRRPLHEGEQRAREARARFGLGETTPITELLQVIEEEAGIPVFIDHFDSEQVAGVILRHGDGAAFIGINADQGVVRQRFTLAHEFGHFFMDHAPRVDLVDDVFGRTKDPQEVAANYFAAEFLAPRAGVVAWVERNVATDAIGVEDIWAMAFHFGVSFPTTCYRLEAAGQITTPGRKVLLAEIAERGNEWRQRGLEFNDSLAALKREGAYPRVPRQTVAYATEARESGLIEADEFDTIVGKRQEIVFDDWLS